MADRLGVYFKEKDLSKTQSALDVPAGAMSIYTKQGRTDLPVLCNNEGDFFRNFGQPFDQMTLASGVIDYGRGMQNALAFIRAGSPMLIKRAIPSAVVPVKGSVNIQGDGAAPEKFISIEALGHGTYYNNISVVVTGIETVQRTVNLVSGTAVSLDDNVVAGTLRVVSGAQTAYDELVTYGDDTYDVTGLTAPGTITVTYQDAVADATNKYTTMNAASTAEVTITYSRTTLSNIVRLYIVDKDETNPTVNYYETFLVSYKEDGVNEAGVGIYIEDVVNDPITGSEIIKVSVDGSYDQTTIPVGTNTYNLDYDLTTDTDPHTMSGGTAGTYAASDADIKTGLQVFRKTRYDITRMYDAGFNDVVKKELGDIAAARIFVHAYIDPPFSTFMDSGNKAKDLTGQETAIAASLTNWRTGLGNREFMSLAGSTWGKITDEFNAGRKLWMPPTFKVGAASVIVDANSGPWSAVMGPRRGVIDFEDIVINLYEQRNTLNAKQVNPIVIDDRGIQMYYGNKTMKTVASAMQQSHARKTRSDLSRDIYFIALDYFAEPIIPASYNDLRDEIETAINAYAAGLESFSITIDPTPEDINNQILRVKIGLIFNRIAEEIEITTAVFKNGEDINVELI